ncbi:helix-turn-helix transcriptional regulator [Longispora sp. NPDC051575]|uniref:helix-turn-helix transcriptional regulator n=1 Tax=Longispora sp. NPDC051575 TaxID=3154943 RepID=UPI0034465433
MSTSRHSLIGTVRRALPAGASIDPHHHDEHQIVYASRGVLSIVTPTGTWVAPTDRALWIPAGTTHEHRAYGRTDLNTVGVAVADGPPELTGPAVLAVGSLFRELIVAYTSDGYEGPQRERLYRVLLDQVRHAPHQPIHLPAARDPRLVELCALLLADPADDRTLGELGHQVGASARTLSRLFGVDLGMTFPQWRTQVRLHRALVLLAEGDSVTQVAHRCGWATPSAFIDVFRRTLGYTPGRTPVRRDP